MTGAGRQARATLRYLPQVIAEYLEQIEYYEARAPGLGKLFIDAVRQAETLLIANPSRYGFVTDSGDIRAVVVRRFPFKMHYAIRGNDVVVTAVAHTAREPKQFLSRS